MLLESRTAQEGVPLHGISSLNYFNYYTFEIKQERNFLNISLDLKDMAGYVNKQVQQIEKETKMKPVKSERIVATQHVELKRLIFFRNPIQGLTKMTAYLQKDNQPTMTSYLFTQREPTDLFIRYKLLNISTNLCSSFFPSLQTISGKWILGIWGHSLFQYSITFETSSMIRLTGSGS